MTRDNIRGKMKFIFEENAKGRKVLADIELDEIAKIEITNFMDGFYAGTEVVMHGTIYGSVEMSIADQIVYRYIDLDTTTPRDKVYRLLCEKLGISENK